MRTYFDFCMYDAWEAVRSRLDLCVLYEERRGAGERCGYLYDHWFQLSQDDRPLALEHVMDCFPEITDGFNG